MVVGHAGLQCAFIKTEKFGLSVHFAGLVQDTDGSGRDLQQHIYANLKEDLLQFLNENGTLPTVTMQEHSEEVKKLNYLENETESQKSEIIKLKEEISALTSETLAYKSKSLKPEESNDEFLQKMDRNATKDKNTDSQEIAMLKALLEEKDKKLTDQGQKLEDKDKKLAE